MYGVDEPGVPVPGIPVPVDGLKGVFKPAKGSVVPAVPKLGGA